MCITRGQKEILHSVRGVTSYPSHRGGRGGVSTATLLPNATETMANGNSHSYVHTVEALYNTANIQDSQSPRATNAQAATTQQTVPLADGCSCYITNLY